MSADDATLPVLASRELEPRHAALQALRTGLLALDDERERLADEGDYEALATGAQDIATLQGDLAAIHRQARVDIAKIIDEKEGKDYGVNRAEVDGVGAVEVKGGWRRKGWQSKALLKEVVNRAIDQVPEERIVNEDGEVLDVAESDTLASILDALETCLPITGSLNWRTGEWPTDDKPAGAGLKRWGFDDADYCEREEQPRLAIVPKRKL